MLFLWLYLTKDKKTVYKKRNSCFKKTEISPSKTTTF